MNSRGIRIKSSYGNSVRTCSNTGSIPRIREAHIWTADSAGVGSADIRSIGTIRATVDEVTVYLDFYPVDGCFDYSRVVQSPTKDVGSAGNCRVVKRAINVYKGSLDAETTSYAGTSIPPRACGAICGDGGLSKQDGIVVKIKSYT